MGGEISTQNAGGFNARRESADNYAHGLTTFGRQPQPLGQQRHTLPPKKTVKVRVYHFVDFAETEEAGRSNFRLHVTIFDSTGTLLTQAVKTSNYIEEKVTTRDPSLTVKCSIRESKGSTTFKPLAERNITVGPSYESGVAVHALVFLHDGNSYSLTPQAELKLGQLQ